MIEKLEHLIGDATNLSGKPVLLTGPPRSGKSGLLGLLSERRDAPVLNVGAALGQKLLTIPGTRRPLRARFILKDLADETARQGLLLVDNIELLFDCELRLNPLGLLKRIARTHCVVAVWPGELRENRLSYAEKGHPEHRDYGIDGLVPFELH